MPLLAHIRELRQRLLRAALFWLLATLIAVVASEWIILWLVRPLQDIELVALSPTEAPVMYFQVALVAGLAVALPYILYQIYAFIRPGLRPEERKIFVWGIPLALLLFLAGALFTVEVLVGLSMPVLLSFLGDVVRPIYSLENYLHFVSTLLVWMGLIFQTPLVVYAVARIGWVTPAQLSKARRPVWFLAALAAAVVTPTTDPITMLLVTAPFVVLYEIGVLLARVATRQRN